MLTTATTATTTAQAAVRHAEEGDLGGAIIALADACIYFGRALTDGSLEGSPHDPESEILKARIAILKVAAPGNGMIEIYAKGCN